MSTTHLKAGLTDHSDDLVNRSISDILNGNKLFSMASVYEHGTMTDAWINTAYFCFSEMLNLYFLSEPHTQHCHNVEHNTSVAVAVYDSRFEFHDAAGGKRGLQLFGNCQRASGAQLSEGLSLYQGRFPGFDQVIKVPEDFDANIINSKLYWIKTKRVKIFDEVNFGAEVWVEFEIS